MMANDAGSDNAAASTAPSSSRPPHLYTLQLHESPHPNNNFERYSMQWIVDTNSCTSMQQGDVLFLPQLVTGAGEFEGVRFVGRSHENGGLELWTGGIESPMFPATIVETTKDLRQAYEGIFEKVLQEQGSTLADLFGGQEIVEEFWENPDVERRRRQLHGEWHIPLNECQIRLLSDD